MKILYVEDTLPNLILVERIACKHEVINYPDAETTLHNFRQDNPDIVLVDIKLRGEMDGLELVRYLREWGYEGPVIGITSPVNDSIHQECLDAGCDDFLPKPLQVHRFYKMLQDYSGWPLDSHLDD